MTQFANPNLLQIILFEFPKQLKIDGLIAEIFGVVF
jgi:hypothetical protein